MSEAISQFFTTVFENNAWLATFLIALIPLIELKGAIPFGISETFWAEQALTPWSALLIAYSANLIVIVLLALIFKPMFNWLNKYKFFHAIFEFFTGDIQNKSNNINAQEKAGTKKPIILKMLTVVLFVAFPVPLTGVWTGTCLGALLGLNFWQNCLANIIGNFVCGLLVIFICLIFPSATSILFYIFLALLAVALIFKIVRFAIKRKSSKIETKEE